MRENRKNALAFIAPSNDLAMKKVRGSTPHRPRVRQEGEAASLTFSRLRDRDTYRIGDGDTGGVNRPGSDVAYTLPSRGIGA